MKLRTLCPLAVALAAGGVASAKDPVKLPTVKAAKSAVVPASATVVETPANTSTGEAVTKNQRLAEAVAAKLTATAVTDGADVAIVTDNGTVTVTGPCLSADQKTAILNEVRVVVGVRMVRDGLTVGSGMIQAQAAGPVSGMPPAGVMPGMPGTPGYTGPLAEPAALGAGGGMMPGAAPPLPPYAWPTYAPHNNLSRVAYPNEYPANAFPFIGPFYPFPKVPLGWRSVNMTWEDGHWFFGKTAVPQDYFRVRFW